MKKSTFFYAIICLVVFAFPQIALSQGAGNALEFDGIDDYVLVNDDNSLDITGSITISAWVYNDVSTNNGAIVSKKETNKLNYVFALNSGLLQFSIRDQQGSGSVQHMYTSNQQVGANNW